MHDICGKLKDDIKLIFDSAIKDNNLDKLNKCNLITKLLGIEDNSIEKIIETYGN